MGLIPIYADTTKFTFPPLNPNSGEQAINTDSLDAEPPGQPKRNLVFELHAICPSQKETEKVQKKKKSHGKGSGWGSDADDVENSGYIVKQPDDSGNWVLYSKAFKWIPIGDQKKQLAKDPPKMVHDDIILAKMRPGQEIEARFGLNSVLLKA